MNTEFEVEEVGKSVTDMSKGNQFKFDVWYAEAWSRRQGYFSFKIANNLKKVMEAKKLKINSVLDVCSGSGEFLSFMSTFVPTCVGVDNADGYLEFVRNKFPDIKFEKIDSLSDFNINQKFDLLTCNHDVVNMFLTFDEWKTFFNSAYNHLNDGGYIIFDVYSENKMKTWEKVTFEQDYTLDYVQKVSNNDGICVMDEVYYIRESETLYRKTSDCMLETGFPTINIIEALKEAGFKNIRTVDIDFNDLADIDNVDRIHFVCQK